jgi:hypothetical protein
MSTVNKLTTRPAAGNLSPQASRYSKFALRENPFPSEPWVNRDSSDPRVNGKIFEDSIRERERDVFINYFIKPLWTIHMSGEAMVNLHFS